MRELTKLEKAIVFLDSIEGLEYKYKKFFIDNYNGEILGNAQGVYEFFKEQNAEVMGKSISEMLKDEKFVEKRIETALRGADDIVTIKSDGEAGEYYPENLINTPVPPVVLYLKGNKELLKERYKLSVVGSRKTLPQYLAVAEKISAEISGCGGVIVTGIADGADSAAIKGALKSGKIISVQAGGVSPVTPRNKQNIADEIAKRGLLISENHFGYVPRNFSYPVRNRIIAALSDVTLIVSGDMSSGTKYTAEYANDYGRDVAVLPYGLGVKSGELCKSLLKNGAAMTETAEEVAYLMKMPFEKQSAVNLNDGEKAVYKSIKSGIRSLDELSLRTGMKIYELMAITVSLEMKGLVTKSPDGTLDATD